MQNRNGISQVMLRASRHLKKLYVIVSAVTSKYSQSPDSLIRTMYHPHHFPHSLDLLQVPNLLCRTWRTDVDTAIGSPIKPKGFAMSFIQAAVRGRVDSERAGRNPRQELLDYLSSPLDPSVEDPILWWGVSAVRHCLDQKCAENTQSITKHNIRH